jgi:hypothetical protein
MFISATPVLLPLYALPALIYGSIAWFALKAAGQLNLGALIIAGLLPVIAYWTWSILTGGWEPRALWALGTFAIPALVISVCLWWFTVHGRTEV